jgi:hypothetical protein
MTVAARQDDGECAGGASKRNTPVDDTCAGARRLLRATNQLIRLELAVLKTGTLDEVAFDQMVREFCEAASDAAAAHRDQCHERDVQPAEVTPALRFARWRYENGHLSG